MRAALRDRMAKAPRTATLYINKSESRCGACGLGCSPYEVTHHTLMGYGAWDDDMAGCEARFTAVSSDYVGFPGLEDAIQQMRPDLPFLGLGAP